MDGRIKGLSSIGLLTMAGLLGVACGGGGGTSKSAVPGVFASPRSAAGGFTGAGSQSSGGGPVSDVASQLSLNLPSLQAKIIKNADITLQVKDGTFTDHFQHATLVAARHGGFVSSSQTASGKLHSGTIVIRVPASQFEAALTELKGLGTVMAENITGQDVTSQFVDLQARLRNWESQETVLLRLMNSATTIEDSIKVQRELQDVQLAIEQIRGQLRVLSDQTELSTITTSMAEAGAVPSKPARRSAPSQAWYTGRRVFVGVVTGVVLALGYLIPMAIFALVALLVWLAFKRIKPRFASTE
jgi:hypothetical protein